jgi:YD repeat-containing protein
LEVCEDLTFLPCPRQTAVVPLPLTGSDFSLVYASDRVPGRKSAASLPARNLGLAGWSLDVLHSYDPKNHVLVMGDGTRRPAEAVPLERGDAALAVGAVNGGEVYLFDGAGRQLATLDAVTGNRLLTFTWDERGLASVTEPGNRKTTVVRDDHGDMVAIVSARGYRTRFGVRGGWLAAAADETGNLTRITTTANGLVTAMSPAEGGATKFFYDDAGRLVKVDGPGSRTLAFARRDIDGGFEVRLTTAAKRTEVLRVQRRGDEVVRTFVDTAGQATQVVVSGDRRSVATADGSKIDIELAADPVWGASAPVVTKAVTTTAGGRRRVVHERRSSDASGPGVEPAKVTRSVDVDGSTWTTAYEPAQQQVTSRDPSGLTRTTTFDDAGRPVRFEADGAPPRS